MKQTPLPAYVRPHQPKTPLAVVPLVAQAVRTVAITLLLIISLLLERALGLPLLSLTIAYAWISRLSPIQAYVVSFVIGVVVGTSWNIPYWISLGLLGAGAVWVRKGGSFIESVIWRIILQVVLLAVIVIGVHNIELGIWSIIQTVVWVLGIIWILLPGVRWSVGTTRSFRVSPRLLNQLESLKE